MIHWTLFGLFIVSALATIIVSHEDVECQHTGLIWMLGVAALALGFAVSLT